MNEDPQKSKFQPRRSAKAAPKPQADAADRKSKKQPAGKRPAGSVEQTIPPPPVPVKPTPLDVSNGKALYKKYDKCYYNSVSLGKWVEACVILVNEDGEIMIDTKEECWFTVEEQQEKFKAVGHKGYKPGENVQFNSVTQHCWLDCKVLAVDPVNHAIQVSVKENHWIKVPQQEERVRYPVRPGTDELLWEAGRLLEKDPPDPDLAESKYRKVLHKEDDNVKAIEGLAILMRDHRNNFKAAEELYVQALEESPYEMKVLSDFADLVLVQGRRSEAEELYARLKRVRGKLREFDEELSQSEDEDVY